MGLNVAKGMGIFSLPQDYGMLERVAEAWEFVKGFPVPRFDMTCTCGGTDVKVCSFTFNQKDEIHVSQKGGARQTCDMMFRCRTCTGQKHFSLAVSEDVYALRGNGSQSVLYHWEKALEIINERHD